MNEKIKLPLIAVASFGLGAASMAGFLAWTFSSTFKELNKERPTYKRRTATREN